MNIGSDIGNVTSIACGDKDFLIESRIKKASSEEQRLSADKIFTFDGEANIIEKGDFESEMFKYKKPNFIKLLFYTLYNSSPDSINNVVISMPAKQYKNEKYLTEMKNTIKENRVHTINDRVIIINKIEVIPEGYPIKMLGYLSDDEQEDFTPNAPTLVIDMGGETIDFILFDQDGNFSRAEATEYGLLKVYEKTKTYLDYTFNLNVDVQTAKKYFDGDVTLKATRSNPNPYEGFNNHKKEIIIEALNELLDKVKKYFQNIEQYNVITCGGGAEVIYDVFKELYPQTILVDDIYFNGEGNKIYADLIWKDENEDIDIIEDVKNVLNDVWSNRCTEENKILLVKLWSNDQGKKILSDLYNIENIEEAINTNIADYLRQQLGN